MLFSSVSPSWQKRHVSAMLTVVGRALAAASRTDAEIRREIRAFPSGLEIEMKVLPAGPGFRLKVTPEGELTLIKPSPSKADLVIGWKHLSHAFLALTFQESTARSFANDRLIADGSVDHAVRLVRCLNRLESLILPRFLARLAVKRYPDDLGLREKSLAATRICALSLTSLLPWK
jgi:hypothetical protein